MSENGQDALRSFIEDLYASYGDPERFDAHLDPGITIWESDQTDMLVGVEALDGLRGGRNGETPAPPTVRPVPRGFVVDVYGDTGVVRYDLGVEQLTGEPTGDLFRVTDVLRSSDGHWRIVHHHAEQVAP
ncbi:nuclear transport factor 2 family protein [Nocardioides sp. NPDC092400]|jgi:hypothetical protein|uniref:YybH family protein n=1 Tax=Nocardioides sp. NPDC092400 TaxID=3155196 RepID=UPI0034285013